MTKILALLAFLALPGCATIQNHPYATSFAVAVVAGSIASSQQRDYRVSPATHPTMSQIGAPSCAGGTCQ